MELTIPAALIHAAREYGDAAALAEPGGPRLSYRELHEQVITVARALIAEGSGPATGWPSGPPTPITGSLGALGVLYAGATLVPVSTRFTGHEALDVISRSGARGLIVAGPFLGTDRLAALRAAAREETGRHQATAGPLGRLRLARQRAHRGRPGRGGARLGRLHRPGRGRPGSQAADRAACGPPGRCQRHPVHLRYHRAEQGRDDRPPPVPRRGPGLGRMRPSCPATTVISWSTRSSTASVTRRASWPAW